MYSVLFQAAILITCGVMWRKLSLGKVDPVQVRQALGDLVYYLLLPALVLSVLWKAPLGLDSLRISAVAASGVLLGLGLAALWFRLRGMAPGQAGALILAAGFPNATYLGLPVLEATFGPWGRSVAIQYDLFACTPLLLTVGILIASRHGSVAAREPFFSTLFKVPPLWAALLAVCLNLLQVPPPAWLEDLLGMLGGAVIPLMLFVLGLSLRWSPAMLQRLGQVSPVLLIQLALMPLGVWWLAGQVGLSGDMRLGVVLEAAMPSMVIGVVLCDRFGLDTALYACAVTVGTALSLITLPLWPLFVGY
jgi:predicted permease